MSLVMRKCTLNHNKISFHNEKDSYVTDIIINNYVNKNMCDNVSTYNFYEFYV